MNNAPNSKIEITPAMRRFNAAVEAADLALCFQADEVTNPDKLLCLLQWSENDEAAAKELLDAMTELARERSGIDEERRLEEQNAAAMLENIHKHGPL